LDWLGLRLAIVLSLVSLLWSAALITDFSFQLMGPDKFGLVFNDLARRLMRGDMTINPDLITYEAFVHDGRTYTYFGIFPAILRIPLVLAGAGAYPMARISCITALWIVSFTTIRMTQAVLDSDPPSRTFRPLAATAVIGISGSGPLIYCLSAASIYNEVIFWAAAGTATFNWIVVRRVCECRSLRPLDLKLLALVAGCVLLTRVTCGVALYAGIALLLVWPSLVALSVEDWRACGRTFGRTLRQAAPAIAIAIIFVAAEAAVNQLRWGNPLTPAPLQYYLQYIDSPHRAELLSVLARHGTIDLVRIPFAALHYGLGVKVDELFPQVVSNHFLGIEGPRMVTLLCAPWIVVCACTAIPGVLAASSRRGLLLPLFAAGGIGFLVPLAVPWLCLRYTFDGWGFLTLAAAIGARWLVHRTATSPEKYFRRLGRIAIAATLSGVVVSHAALLRYKINYFGTTPSVRYALSRELQPLICPNARLTADVKLTDFIPLVTPSCPPLW
jgi:hypothetical protein